MVLIAVIFAALLLGFPAFALDKPLDDPALEARAIELNKELRCLVCQNQAISESNAPLAADLRQVVRDRIAAGDSDQQVMNYLVERYGDWVLLDPPFKLNTWALWLGPALLLVIGGVGVRVWVRRQSGRNDTAQTALSADEQARLTRLLEQDGQR
ncbi:MAG: cytochrome c-type biogenesis protein CcmH [Alphaproteobacteria bacterium]